MWKQLLKKYIIPYMPSNVYRGLTKSMLINIMLNGYVLEKRPSPILVNSIPKSGTNLLRNIVLSIPHTWYVADMEEAVWKFFEPDERLRFVKKQIIDLRPGCVYTGHIPYSDEIASWLSQQGIKQLFIYRDPRDVTVSYYHYVMEYVGPAHFIYGEYNAVDSDAERLLISICGVGEGKFKYHASSSSLPNIKLVYDNFIGWINDKNTYSIRFEDLIDRDDKAIKQVKQILEFIGVPSNDQVIYDILRQGSDPQKSHTFRRGVAGSWKEEYTVQHIDAFKKVGGDNLLEKLGYVWD